MNIFHDYTFSWQQMGLFKISLISLGIVFGSRFSDFFSDYSGIFLLIFIGTGIYLAKVSVENFSKSK